jgi:hypothetical protein
VIFVVGLVVGAAGIGALWAAYTFSAAASSHPTFTMEGMAVSFAGAAANTVQLDPVSGGCLASVCGSAPAGGVLGTFLVEVSVRSSDYNCSNLDQYEITQVKASPSGAFVVTAVAVTGVPLDAADPNETLPMFLPYVTQGGCAAVADIWFATFVVDQGPATQPLYLSVSVT